MFLCDPCHGPEPCAGSIVRSSGRCEVCGKRAACLDCHTPTHRGSKPPVGEIKRNGPEGPRVNTTWTEYTDAEIIAAWSLEEQGHRQAVARGLWCVVVECDKYDAVSLSRLWIRNIFALPSACHYDGKTLSLYCGDGGSGASSVLRQTTKLVTFWPIVEYERPCSSCGYPPSKHYGRGECP